MKKTHKKIRLISLLLVAALVLTLLPTVALAASGYCSMCGGTYSYSLGYEQWTSSEHCVRHWCSNCGSDQLGGVSGESHSYSGNTCTKCGYTKACSHTSTYTSSTGTCTYDVYCSTCGAYLSSGTSHSYSYGNWSYYNGSIHRRSYSCIYGDTTTTYDTQSHSWVYGDWEYYTSTTHKQSKTCSVCGYKTYVYQNHSKTKSYKYIDDDEYHEVTTTCSVCGYSATEKEEHNIKWGSYYVDGKNGHSRDGLCSDCNMDISEYGAHTWTTVCSLYSAGQHMVTKTCSLCGTTAVSYEDHTLTFTDWKASTTDDDSHERTATCASCGYSGTEIEAHDWNAGSWEYATADVHRQTSTCDVCGKSIVSEEAHSCGDPVLTKLDDTLHSVSKTCKVCKHEFLTNEEHTLVQGDTWTSYNDDQHVRTDTCACGYSELVYADHVDKDGDGICDDCGRITARFSVTVPASMALAVDENGGVTTATNVKITNNSTATVTVKEVSISSVNGWTIVPYSYNMASAKVDSRLIGFQLNSLNTSQTGTQEDLYMKNGWEITKDSSLPISYDAVVSATSGAITGQQVLSVVFVVDWS